MHTWHVSQATRSGSQTVQSSMWDPVALSTMPLAGAQSKSMSSQKPNILTGICHVMSRVEFSTYSVMSELKRVLDHGAYWILDFGLWMLSLYFIF